MNFINKRSFNYKLLGRLGAAANGIAGVGVDDAEQHSDNERFVLYIYAHDESAYEECICKCFAKH